MFHRVSTECILSSDTLISHECAHIRDIPTLKDVERFRTGSMIHEYKLLTNIPSGTKKANIPSGTYQNLTKNLAKSLTQNVI